MTDHTETTHMVRLVARVEATVTVTDALHRPYGIAGIVLVAAAALLPLLLLPLRYGLPGAALLAAAVALYWVATIYLATRISAGRNFRRAARCWWTTTATGGQATAALIDVKGRPTLRYVAARPRRAGAGSDLLTQICADADTDQIEITLRAVNNAAANLYRRHGFIPAPHSMLDRISPTMVRPYQPTQATN